MKNILLVGILALGLVGCDGMNQNPLADKNAVLENGQPEPSPEQQSNATSSDALRIISADFYRLKENETGEFSVGVRNFLPGYSTQLSVENMAEFPGAVFTESTGVFKWKPLKGAILPSENEKYMQLKLKVIASKAGEPSIFKEKEVQIVINRLYNVPKIVEISKSMQSMVEGDISTVTVTIEDADADPSDKRTWASIQIMPTENQKSLSGYMTLTSYSAQAFNRYQAVFQVDLRNADVTDSGEMFFFDINVVSRFLKATDTQKQFLKVMTSFSEIMTTWDSTQLNISGNKIQYNFLVFDPKNELNVSYTLTSEIPGSTTSCLSQSRSVLVCQFTADITNLIMQPYTFTLTTTASNKDLTDQRKVTKDHQLTVNLARK